MKEDSYWVYAMGRDYGYWIWWLRWMFERPKRRRGPHMGSN